MVTDKNAEKAVVKKKENKFEFALFVNDFKIISRYIKADNYSPQVRNSIDIRDAVDEIAEIIQEVLKRKDLELMYEGYDLTQRSGKVRSKVK